MKFKQLLVFSLAATAFGCSKSHLIESRQRHQAPKNAHDVGIVLEGAQPSEVEKILATNAQAQVRVLNQEHGMYEVFGVTPDQAQTLTRGRATPNSFFETQREKQISKTFAVAAPRGLKVGNLNACRTSISSTGPTAKLEALQPSQLDDGTIELGAKVKVSGSRSIDAVRSALIINGPSSSQTQESILNQNTAEFTPDALGVYHVFLVVQNAGDLCSMDALRFVVTANRPFKTGKSPQLKVDLSKFWHLQALQAQEAWQIGQGEGMTIAIIDTGVDYNQPLLNDNILVNEKEIANNQIDDDGNGLVDDVVGYDFANHDAFPYDDDGHGTHVSGLAASKYFGLARKAKILPIKALNGIGGDMATIAAAVRYAVDRGAKIINLSLGGAAPAPHPALVEAVNYAEQKGVILVVAVGNGDAETGMGFNIDKKPVFPASLPNENIITVAAMDGINPLAVYSNFGKIGVDVVAPGGGEESMMISAAFENPAGRLVTGMVGTSMAAPVTAGITADVWALNPRLTYKEVRQILISAGDEVEELKPVTVSGRHLNARQALEGAMAKNVLF